MSRKKKKIAKPTMAIPRPEELAFLKRWQGVRPPAPSLWTKMEKDVAYEAAVKARGDDSLSNQWGIGKPYPKKKMYESN